MTGTLKRVISLGAALLLMGITLSVFYVLQDYGPESAIRRFHAALEARRWEELDQLTKDPVDSQSTKELILTIDNLRRAGARYQLMRLERSGRQAKAAVVYTLPNQQPMPMIWIVEKDRGTWRINSDQTFTLLRESLGF